MAPRSSPRCATRRRASSRRIARCAAASASTESTLLAEGARVLTHCNAGALATAGIGTALAPVYVAAERGRRVAVFADETRPLLQGSRLTAWELSQAGIDVTVLADSMAASLMREGRVDLVIVGADRIAANGDVANKIGTYPLALAARHHGIPFYVAAPWSTVDPDTPSGDAIAHRAPCRRRAGARLRRRRRARAGGGLQPRLRRHAGRARVRVRHRPRDHPAAVPLRARRGTPSRGRGSERDAHAVPPARAERSPSRSTSTAIASPPVAAAATGRRCCRSSRRLARRARCSIGQAPGQVETSGGKPFAGRAGRTLFRWLERAGLDEPTARERLYISAITRCYPGSASRRPRRSGAVAGRARAVRRLAGRRAAHHPAGARHPRRPAGDRPLPRRRSRWTRSSDGSTRSSTSVGEPSRSRCRIRAAPAAGSIRPAIARCSSARSTCSEPGSARPDRREERRLMRGLFLVFTLGTRSPQHSSDRWFGPDKLQHFFASAFVQSIGYGTLRAVGADHACGAGGSDRRDRRRRGGEGASRPGDARGRQRSRSGLGRRRRRLGHGAARPHRAVTVQSGKRRPERSGLLHYIVVVHPLLLRAR